MWCYLNGEIWQAIDGDCGAGQEIPAPTAPGQMWNVETQAWVANYAYNWLALKGLLRSTALFSKAFGTANANAFTLLLSTLESQEADNEARWGDFVFALNAIRLGLEADFTQAEIEEFNQKAGMAGFPPYFPN